MVEKVGGVYTTHDLVKLNMVPSGWEAKVIEIARSDGRESVLDGKSSTSREPPNTNPVRLKVVTGEVISTKLPWLHQLYRGQLLTWASEYAGRKMAVARDIVSGVNINCLEGRQSRYERHVDSNPVTGLLFASTLRPGDGGELVFERDGGAGDLIVNPVAGTFLLFDARHVTHYVKPLEKAPSRLSVPMNYYFEGDAQARPTDLDGYLYKA